MKSKTFLLALGCLFYLLTMSALAQSEKTPLDPNEILVRGQKDSSKWLQAESQHFIVYSDVKTEDVTTFLNLMERFDYLLRIYTDTEKKAEKQSKLVLYYFSSANDLKKISSDQPEYAIGLYNSCTQGVQGFAVHLRSPKERTDDLANITNLNTNISYLFEGYARHFLYRNTDIRTPTWFIDGFAHYFSSTRFTDTQVIVGKAPGTIFEYLQFLSNHRRALDYQDILDQKEQGIKSYGGKAGSKLEFEARSWLLTHYLLSSTENLSHLRQYATLINQNMSPKKAFEQAFGYKPSQLSYKLWEYRHKTAKSLLLDIKTLPTADISFSRLAKSANDVIPIQAALMNCADIKQTKQLIEKLKEEIEEFPNSDLAKITLSRAYINAGSPKEAVEYLTQLTLKDKSNFDGFYLLGLAQLRLSENEIEISNAREALIESAQKNLVRALKLNPQSAEALFAYYKAGILRAEPSEASLGSALLASQLSNEVASYKRATALTYTYLNRPADAQPILNTLIQNTRDPNMAEWAKAWQVRMQSGVNKSDVLVEMRTEPKGTLAFKEWTIGSEFVIKTATADAGMEDAQNFILNEQDAQRNRQNQPINSPNGPGMSQ